MKKLEDASLNILVILLQDKSSLKKVPRWLTAYLRTNIYIEKDDPLFFRKLIIGMNLMKLDQVPPPGEMPYLYGDTSGDLAMTPVRL